MTAPEHRAGPEFRVAGRTLTGTVLRYGDTSPEHRERFEPGAFAPVPDVPMRLQHDPAMEILPAGSFVLSDTPRALEIRAELSAGSAALALTRRGACGGWSIGFHSRQERRESGVRLIERAELVEVSLVDVSSYPDSLAEVRRGGGGGRGIFGGRLGTFRGRVPVNKEVDCRCSPGDCTSALFEQGSFDNLLSGGGGRDVLSVAGDYSAAIGSEQRGSIRFWRSKDGGLEFAADIPNNSRGQALLDTLDVADVYARPVLDTVTSKYTKAGTLARYTDARVRAMTIGPTDANDGWDALERVAESAGTLADKAAKLSGLSRPARRRARVWLP